MNEISNLPKINFPPDLPVSQRIEDIKNAIESNQIVIICGETGSGKTTQLPKICLSLGRGRTKLIGHTQPRRIAARSVATRIAEEVKTPLGEWVGFKVRFTDKISKKTAVKVMTDGILLAETQNDPLLKQYDTLILDEAHERSLNIDFLLGYVKNILPQRPDLKVIITSATIDTDKFSSHFNNAPIVQVSGRTFPVEMLYRPLQKQTDEVLESLEDAILDTIHDLGRQGDILVFLPGERDIHDVKKHLVDQLKNQWEVLPLFSRLSVKDQQKIFQPSAVRRIILSTNIAETSLTVPGIKFVIDTGLARVVRYNPRLKIEQLLIEKISQASANQRAGRCGRIAPGTCIRLYDEKDFDARSAFTDPEILRTSLASVILKMASLNLGPVDQFPFLQAPIYKFIQDGYQLLHELGAVDADHKILSMGRQLAQLPIDPSLGRILLEAKQQNCLAEILVIISALSISDPKDRPLDKAQQADQAHLQFHDPKSGFMGFLKLWMAFKKEVKGRPSKALRIFCQKNFLSFMRMREWQELHKQLLQIIKELGFRLSQTEATYDQIHQALLSGLLGNLGFKEGDGYEYKGTRGIKFLIGPRLYRNKNFKWIMAAEIIDTGRLYAQCIAQIDVSWVEKLAVHLVDFEYSNPRWNKKLSRVDATQKTLLYGLIINPSKTVHYGSIDLVQSREIFIRQGLVEMEYETTAPFWNHNLSLINEIEKLEHKSRRQDILISEDILCQFYDNKIASDVMNGAGFESWRKVIERDDSKYLFLTKEYLMQRSADQVDEIQYPESIDVNNIPVRLKYHFEPNHPNDGLTAAFSFSSLSQIKPEKFDWLVPGMIREKVTFLVKAMPKSLRGQCGPAPKFVTEFLAQADHNLTFNEALTQFIRKKTNTHFKVDNLLLKTLPEHLKVNFSIIDEVGHEIDSSRDLSQLQRIHKEKVTEVIKEIAFNIEQENLKYWPEFDIPETVSELWNGDQISGFPALINQGDYVDLKVLDHPEEAHGIHYQGVKCLLQMQLRDKVKVLQKIPPRFDQFALFLRTYIDSEDLKDNYFEVVMNESMAWKNPVPRTQKEFNLLVAFAKKRISEAAQELSESLVEIAKAYHDLSVELNNLKHLPQLVLNDVDEQLEVLLPPYEKPLFLFEKVFHIPRYLKAIKIRVKKYSQHQDKDREVFRGISRLQEKWIEKVIDFVENEQEIPRAYIDFQWAIQELRVSLYAQELKTPYPISVKRLDKVWANLVNQ